MTFGQDGESASPCCSADLHQVLDCNTGQVVTTCASDMGCGAGGSCVGACDSASANHSTIGCEYYALDPDALSNTTDDPESSGSYAGSCYAVFIANTWSSPVSVQGTFDGMTLNLSGGVYLPQGSGTSLSYMQAPGGQIPADQVGIVFVAETSTPTDNSAPNQHITCPAGVVPAYSGDPAIHGTGLGAAFHLTTSAPVVAYDIFPYGGARSTISSATLLLPVSAWDVNYVFSTGFPGQLYGGHKMDGTSDLVAAEDDTTVTVVPTSAIAGGPGVAAAAANAPQAYSLMQGQVIQFEQFDELSGSVVVSNKPIGTWGGHVGMSIPDPTVRAVDAAHQQIPPVKALGSEYVAVRYRSRTATEESVPWRLVGAVDGTTLSYEPATPSGAPTSLARGQVVEFNSTGPFVVTSQDKAHPFFAAAHMTGSGLVSNDTMDAIGDPETVNIVPSAQFLSRYVFFTDPTYGYTDLVVIREVGTGNDVTLDCTSGPLAGWTPIGTRYEYTRVDVQADGGKVGACDNGRHEMTSAMPFGLTVWGYDLAVSYAYPAGAGVKAVNSVVVPAMPR
jgi:hypothetical protein